jgi:tubulin-folding cofactor B
LDIASSNVPKYEMPPEDYGKRTDSVLAWKKANKLGRFDPNAPSLLDAKIAAIDQEVATRGIEVGKRCRVGGEDVRRGVIMYVGAVPQIPGHVGSWVGVQLDEPLGKNDGSIAGSDGEKTRYWHGKEKCGVFVRPERVEVGDWPVLNDLEDMEEM